VVRGPSLAARGGARGGGVRGDARPLGQRAFVFVFVFV
jgi:hypothetical protein